MHREHCEGIPLHEVRVDMSICQGHLANAEQTIRFDLLPQEKAMIQAGTMMTLGNKAQGLDFPRSLLT